MPEHPVRQVDPIESERHIHPLANAIRTLFILAYRHHHLSRTGQQTRFGEVAMPRWDGGEGPRGRIFRPIWYKVARITLDRRIAPEALIEAAFEDPDRGPLPLPPTLLSPSVIDLAVENRGLLVEELRCGLKNQLSYLHTHGCNLIRHHGFDRVTAVHHALVDEILGLSAIFRFCIAASVVDREVADRYGAETANEYVRRRWFYDQAWGNFIAPELKQMADRIIGGG